MFKYDHKDVNTTFRDVFSVVSKQQFISTFLLSLFRLCREECQIFSAWSFWYFTYIRSDRLNTVCICLELHFYVIPFLPTIVFESVTKITISKFLGYEKLFLSSFLQNSYLNAKLHNSQRLRSSQITQFPVTKFLMVAKFNRLDGVEKIRLAILYSFGSLQLKTLQLGIQLLRNFVNI